MSLWGRQAKGELQSFGGGKLRGNSTRGGSWRVFEGGVSSCRLLVSRLLVSPRVVFSRGIFLAEVSDTCAHSGSWILLVSGLGRADKKRHFLKVR